MKTTKKILSVLLIICISFSFCSISVSALAETIPNFEKFTDYWIETQYNEKATVNEIIPIIDGEDKTIGYSISFINNDKPCGYVILDISDNYDSNPIIEYSLEGNDPYTAMSNKVNKDFSNIGAKVTKTKKLRTETFYNYGVEVSTTHGKKVYSSSEGLISKSSYDEKAEKRTEEYNKTKKEFYQKNNQDEIYVKASTNFYDAWLNTAPGTAKTTKTITKAGSFKSLNMYDMPSYSGSSYTAGYYDEYNCGPTTLTIIMKYWDECRGMSNLLKSNSIPTTYKRISKLCGYTPTEGTSTSKLTSTIKTYAKEQGYTATVNSYLLDTWSNFKNDLDKNKTILLAVQGKLDGVLVGHGAVVLGYRINTDGSKYLRVADCWSTSTNRYIKFKPPELSSFQGYAVSISA